MKYNYFKTIWVVFTCLIFTNVFSISEVYASDNVSSDITTSVINSYRSTAGDTYATNETINEGSSGINDSYQKQENSADISTILINDPEVPSGGSISSSAANAARSYGIGGKTLNIDDNEYKNKNYFEEFLAKRLVKNGIYEVYFRDMITKDVLNEDAISQYMEYTTISKGEEVTVQGFADSENGKFVILKASDGENHYENIQEFYRNTIYTDDSKLKQNIHIAVSNALMYGSEKSFKLSILFTIIVILGSFMLLYFLDNNVFRLQNPDNPVFPYLSGCFRIMPGAMLGCFITIMNVFDANAISYYFCYGFSLLGQGYRAAQWIIQVVLLIVVLISGKIVIESCRCYTMPCMTIRTLLLFITNLFILYMFYILSFVGVALYTLFIIYQCVFYQSFLINESAVPEPDAAPQPQTT